MLVGLVIECQSEEENLLVAILKSGHLHIGERCGGVFLLQHYELFLTTVDCTRFYRHITRSKCCSCITPECPGANHVRPFRDL